MLYKYPRTPHLPNSLGATKDDKRLANYNQFIDNEVVITEKLDGENTSLYRTYFHARSLDSKNHPSRNWLKNFHASFSHNIPPDYRICGENLFAKHSIHYTELDSYFYAFSVWMFELCLSWDDTVELCDELALAMPVVYYRGIYDQKVVDNLATELDFTVCEGFVVRNTKQFTLPEFSANVAKFVRLNHVQTDKHWSKAVIKNLLKCG